ncbi:MAG TPA: glycosyltransferase family 2 protein [Gemmatimonadales bacterium]
MLEVVLWTAYGIMGGILAANVRYLNRRRGLRGTFPADRLVSILIPARNEERNLTRLLPTILDQVGVHFEVIVYDDDSNDGTARVVADYDDARVRLIRGSGPPAGWVGKVHALYQASRIARGQTLLFLDADTAFKHPAALAEMLGRFAALPPRAVLTGLLDFRGGGRILVSAIPHALLLSLPLPLIGRIRTRFLGALNGQCWMTTAALYREWEPHRTHPDEVLEDIRIGQYFAAHGIATHFAPLNRDLEVWMYRDFSAAWRGFLKNTYPLMGGRPIPFLGFNLWFAFCWVAAPWLAWPFLVPMYLTKLAADRVAGLPLHLSAFAPLTFLLTWFLQLHSAFCHLSGRVQWKGRNVASARPKLASPR